MEKAEKKGGQNMKDRIKELQCMGFSYSMAVVLICKKPDDLDEAVYLSLDDWLQIYATAPQGSEISTTALTKARNLAKTSLNNCQIYLAIVKTESKEATEAVKQLNSIMTIAMRVHPYELPKSLAAIYDFALQHDLHDLAARVRQNAIELVQTDQREERELSFQLIATLKQITTKGDIFSYLLWKQVQKLIVLNEWRLVYEKAENVEIRQLAQTKLLLLADTDRSMLISLHRDAIFENDKEFIAKIQEQILHCAGNLYEFYATLEKQDAKLKDVIAAICSHQALSTDTLGAFYDKFRGIYKQDDNDFWSSVADILFTQANTTEELISLSERLNHRNTLSYFNEKLLASLTSFDGACAAVARFPYQDYQIEKDKNFSRQIIIKTINLATDFEKLIKLTSSFGCCGEDIVNLASDKLYALAIGNFDRLHRLYSEKTFENISSYKKEFQLDGMTFSAKTLEEKFIVYKIRYKNTDGKAADPDKATDMRVQAGEAVNTELSSLDNCLLFLTLKHESCFIGWFIEHLIVHPHMTASTFNEALRIYRAVAKFKSENYYRFNAFKSESSTDAKNREQCQILILNARNNLLRFMANINEAAQACEASKADPEFYAEVVTKTRTFIK
jgi:hypothetical protein